MRYLLILFVFALASVLMTAQETKTYYSIADGGYSTASTWSNEGYDGAAASTAPTAVSDIVMIGNNHTVTLSEDTPLAARIEVENGGTLIAGEHIVFAIVFRLKEGATLGLGHPEGLMKTGLHGNVQTASERSFDKNTNYIFSGGNDQTTGDAFPTEIGTLTISKGAKANTVTLSRALKINQELKITDGTFDINGNDLSGQGVGTDFTMSGGKIIFYTEFPEYFRDPSISGGEIEFTGTREITIPSGGTQPAISQYFDLTISGTKDGFVYFPEEGEVKIKGTLDISNLNFANTEEQNLKTYGSTVVFNGDGDQQIPRNTLLDHGYGRVIYNNVHLQGSGTKIFEGTRNVLTGDLIVDGPSAAFTDKELEVQGDFLLNSGDIDFGTNGVLIMNNLEVDGQTTLKTLNKPLHILKITGLGDVLFEGDMTIEEELIIESSRKLISDGNKLTVKRKFTNKGLFIHGNGTVEFQGSEALDMDTEIFYDLIVNKPESFIVISNNNYLSVENDLEIIAGRIFAHLNTYVAVKKSIKNPGDGYIEGKLRIFVPEGDASGLKYYIGANRLKYTAEIDIKGSGGYEGYLEVFNEAAAPELFESHNGSTLIFDKSVQRVWTLTPGASTNFLLGTRTLDIVLNYDPSEVKGEPTEYIIRRLENNEWFGCETVQRSSTSTKAADVSGIGKFIVGETVIISAEETNSPIALDIYPNPVSHMLRADFLLEHTANTDIKIFSEDGKMINQYKYGLKTAGMQSFNISVSDLPSGVYYLALLADETTKIKKFIVVK